MDEIKAKQQVVEKIKESAKILVTVSDNPSVDALSAALALTMLLDKQEKYATAIFSGQTPPAIAFLEPEKTFDDTTDSLRDFIIALNKEKADHLRYKVEGDSVKIFITPYKTTIDQSDLEFSQGDYNVELVIALGVDNQDHLDSALENHGQILHDAAIVTISAGDQSSDLGGIDWHDAGASSLSEMVTGLAEALKEDKKKSLIDAPIATALLTGIVAETDRFSNEHTTSKVMTVSAALMSAGADQQLIANELQALREAPAQEEAPDEPTITEDESDVEIDATSNDGSLTIKKDHDPSALEITHENETLADLDRRVLGDEKAKEKVIDEVEATQEEAAEEERKEEAASETVPPIVSVTTDEPISAAYSAEDEVVEPTLGGTLNATTEQAAEDAQREIDNDQNRTILSHSYLGGDAADTEVHSAYAVENNTPIQQESTPAPMEVGGERSIQPLMEEAQAAALPASDPAPVVPPTSAYAPNPTPTDLGLPLPPPLPDFSQVNSVPMPAIPLPPTSQPEILGDILAPEPTQQYAEVPGMPFEATNTFAAPNTAYAPEQQFPQASVEQMAPQPAPQYAPAPQSQPNPADPGQFQIPPQQ